MPNTYLLSNRFFDTKVSAEGVSDIFCSFDPLRTQVVRATEAYGILQVRYRVGDELFSANTSMMSAEEEFSREKDKMTACFTYRTDDGALVIRNCFTLAAGDFIHDFSFENALGQEVEIVDLSTHFPSNTHFGWGEPAGDKLIGHNFVGGHGSYIYYTRCDHNGPFLMILPSGETKLEYFFTERSRTLKKWREGARGEYFKGYIHAKAALAEAQEEHGTTWRHPVSSKTLAPGEKAEYRLTYFWVDGNDEAVRDALYERGTLDILSVPGYTLPRDMDAKLSVRTKYQDIEVIPEYPESTEVKLVSHEGDRYIYDIKLTKLGENKLTLRYDGGKKWTDVQYFITQPVKTLLAKRAKFISEHQVRDESLWYNGLLAEINNETGVWLGPDNYDGIHGWRIYAVTCDDPALGMPAFLSGQLAEHPVQEQVEAMDYYIENFIWGGMQMTEEEEYPYGVYGTPDWHMNRTAEDHGLGSTPVPGRLHMWRIYDYPHVALMYFNMYRIARDYPEIKTALTKEEYLKRAYQTARAQFIYPMELDGWTAYHTGTYNELCYEEIIQELRKCGYEMWAQRLQFHWDRKVKYFVTEATDIFGSEYPFDTTGFESTHVFARNALRTALPSVSRLEHFRRKEMTYDKAVSFMRSQLHCNLACRGTIEPSWFWYGSDYRSCNYNTLLSYMSTMGGASILDYSLHYTEEPFEFMRIGFGAMLSSLAIINAGDEESNYGYWFPGKEMDGTSCGVYDALPYGETWLDQKHHRGPWYYSGESDLAYCGALHGLSTVFAKDPIFGEFVYGGRLNETEDAWLVSTSDGVDRRFHYVAEDQQLNFHIDRGHFSAENPITVAKDLSRVTIPVAADGIKNSECQVFFRANQMGSWKVLVDGKPISAYTVPSAANGFAKNEIAIVADPAGALLYFPITEKEHVVELVRC